MISLTKKIEDTPCEAVAAIKKQTTQDVISKQPQEIIDMIFAMIEFEDLNAFTYASKQWHILTAKTPFWINLCLKAGIIVSSEGLARNLFVEALNQKNGQALLASGRHFSESKNILTETNLKRALIDFNAASLNREICEIYGPEIKSYIGFLLTAQAAKGFGASQPSSTPLTITSDLEHFRHSQTLPPTIRNLASVLLLNQLRDQAAQFLV